MSKRYFLSIDEDDEKLLEFATEREARLFAEWESKVTDAPMLITEHSEDGKITVLAEYKEKGAKMTKRKQRAG